MNITKRLVLAVATVAVASCGVIAVQTAPAKMASVTRGESAKNADVLFWEALHSGDYNGLPQAIRALTAAYLQDTNDSVTAAHLGWAHIWRLAESSRLDEVPPTITDHAVLARRYFQEAVALDPSDARYLGFLGSTQLAEGNIHRDEKLTRTGYFTLLASIEAWPEFNLFTAGYMMSRLPADSPRFKQGLEWQWQNLDVCVGEKVDRLEPDFTRYMSLAVEEGKKRVCWDSWIAPHNLEGFFLNMGDMLVKSGDWQTAKKVYSNAKLAPAFGNWKYASVLQSRIDRAQDNVAVFSASAPGRGQPGERIMFDSNFSCMACHQR